MTIDQMVSQLETLRLLAQEAKLKRCLDRIEERLLETDGRLDELSNQNDELDLVEQLIEFVQLTESFASTLESASRDPKDEVQALRNIQKFQDRRENRSKESLELICHQLNGYQCIQNAK